jgi:hypothetical protein
MPDCLARKRTVLTGDHRKRASKTAGLGSTAKETLAEAAGETDHEERGARWEESLSGITIEADRQEK